MENELINVMMISSLLDETTEEFEMLKENFNYAIETILEDCYDNLFSNKNTHCEKEELLEIINIPIVDVLKNPPATFKDIWDYEISNIVYNYGGKHNKLGKWFNKYFTNKYNKYFISWEDLEGEKLEQYNKIYQKQLNHYLNERWTNGLGEIKTNMNYLNRLEQDRQQYLKQIR